jgi:hypothetical protein
MIAGHCGWSPAQLASELNRNVWFHVATPDSRGTARLALRGAGRIDAFSPSSRDDAAGAVSGVSDDDLAALVGAAPLLTAEGEKDDSIVYANDPRFDYDFATTTAGDDVAAAGAAATAERGELEELEKLDEEEEDFYGDSIIGGEIDLAALPPLPPPAAGAGGEVDLDNTLVPPHAGRFGSRPEIGSWTNHPRDNHSSALGSSSSSSSSSHLDDNEILHETCEFDWGSSGLSGHGHGLGQTSLGLRHELGEHDDNVDDFDFGFGSSGFDGDGDDDGASLRSLPANVQPRVFETMVWRGALKQLGGDYISMAELPVEHDVLWDVMGEDFIAKQEELEQRMRSVGSAIPEEEER